MKPIELVMNIPVKSPLLRNYIGILTYNYDFEHNARFKFAFNSL